MFENNALFNKVNEPAPVRHIDPKTITVRTSNAENTYKKYEAYCNKIGIKPIAEEIYTRTNQFVPVHWNQL